MISYTNEIWIFGKCRIAGSQREAQRHESTYREEQTLGIVGKSWKRGRTIVGLQCPFDWSTYGSEVTVVEFVQRLEKALQ